MKEKKTISNFHYITQDIDELSHVELIELACDAGIDWIQLRVKSKTDAVCKQIALEAKTICAKYGAALIINDNVELAMEIDADGVHLGKEDMSPLEAREILGDDFLIGGTANTIDDIKKLSNELGQINRDLEDKEMRWLELSEFA